MIYTTTLFCLYFFISPISLISEFIFFGPVFNEANEPSSTCRLRFQLQVEASTPPLGEEYNVRLARDQFRSGKQNMRSAIMKMTGQRKRRFHQDSDWGGRFCLVGE